MTDIVVGRSAIRPSFVKASVVAFVLLLPFVAHAAWNYQEESKLGRAIREIESRGEPTTLPEPRLDRDALASERYYRAAAALASDFLLETQASLRVPATDPSASGWPSDIAPFRSAVRKYDASLAFADRAAELPFQGFRIGTAYPTRTSDLMSVQRLSGYRAMVLAEDGDEDGAVASLTTAVQLGRPLQQYAYTLMRASDAVHVLEHAKASVTALARLGAALDALDDDQDLSRWLEELRRRDLTSPRGEYGTVSFRDFALANLFFFGRPWAAHVLNGQLQTFAALVAAAKAPWPDRIDRTIAVGGGDLFPAHVPGSASVALAQAPLEGLVLSSASKTATFRSLRAAIAVEQYRREHAERLPGALAELVPAYMRGVPVDPFSGRALLMKVEADGYSVYSVGVNRADDGGRDMNLPYVPFPTHPLADTGVRVRVR